MPSPAWRGCRPQAAGVEGTHESIGRARLSGKTSHPRRGGCPHPPGRSGARAGGLYVSSHRSCPSGPGAMWASPPTRISGCCRSTEPGLIRQGSPPHPALGGHLLQAGEGMGLLVLGCRKIYGHSHSSWPGSLGGLGSPSSVPGCARSTFPGGEGDLPAGAAGLRLHRILTSPTN